MNNEMEQGSKRRRRKQRAWNYNSTLTSERTDTATRSGPVVSNVPINAEVSKVAQLTQWQDAEGKHHRIDCEHQTNAETPFSVRTEAETDDDEECRSSAPEFTPLASELAQSKGRDNQFTIEHSHLSSIDHEREAMLRSERLAITRERELLIQDRELLVRERELLAADRRRLSLEFARHVDREAPTERDTTQSVVPAEIQAAVNRQFRIPVCEDSSEEAEHDSGETRTTTVTHLGLAPHFGIDRVERHVDDGGSQDDELPSTATEQRYVLDSQHRIDDLHCHLAQLFELPPHPRKNVG